MLKYFDIVWIRLWICIKLFPIYRNMRICSILLFLSLDYNFQSIICNWICKLVRKDDFFFDELSFSICIRKPLEESNHNSKVLCRNMLYNFTLSNSLDSLWALSDLSILRFFRNATKHEILNVQHMPESFKIYPTINKYHSTLMAVLQHVSIARVSTIN